MKYQRAKRDPLRSLTSEMLPYEVPLPFSSAGLYRFLRRLNFEWETEKAFSVRANKLGKPERLWLKLIFDGINFDEYREDGGRIRFELNARNRSLTKRLLNPYKYGVKRNNGKIRELTVLHPQSMLGMSYLLGRYRDSILYFTNRSVYSIRHPYRIARVYVQHDHAFRSKLDQEEYGVEQFDLEYGKLTSYFSYKRYNNINRFYSSPEFHACERKYPLLIRADISKCFDSIYTHTISWVTNGRGASKQEERSAINATFGGKFDGYLQYLNYAETSGIVIGPEFSRIFAEIILQEVDVRVAQDLDDKGLRHGRDYEVMRYVDDYFIFLADPNNGEIIETSLSHHLAHFKLHLNAQKQESFETPLKSHMSIAKLSLREAIKARTKCEIANEENPVGDLFFSSGKSIIDYKAILVNTEREHGELANAYLYELSRRVEKTLNKFGKHLDTLKENGDVRSLTTAQGALVKYLVATLDVAVFVYSGAPSVSHSLKLAKMIARSLRELDERDVSYIEIQFFRSKVRREILAQLSAVRDESTFGVHTLNLLDCLFFLDPAIGGSTLDQILKQRHKAVETLDVFGVLTLLRCCGHREDTRELREKVLARAKEIIEQGATNPDLETERAILLLTLPGEPNTEASELSETTGLDIKEAQILQKWKGPNMLFAWNASDHYFERLQLKSGQSVY